MITKVTTMFFVAALAIWISGCGQSRLTQQEILKIADGAAISKGLDLEEYRAYYDEGNAQSKDVLGLIKTSSPHFAKKFKTLKQQDLQAVIYKRKSRRTKNGTYTFIINNKTGRVIAVLKGK